MQELGDLVVEDVLEHVLGELDAGLVGMFLLDFDESFDALESHPQGDWFLN